MSVRTEWAELGGDVELYQPGELEDVRGQVNDRLGWPIDEVIIEGTAEQFKEAAERILHLVLAEKLDELLVARVEQIKSNNRRTPEWQNGFQQGMAEASKIFRRIG